MSPSAYKYNNTAPLTLQAEPVFWAVALVTVAVILFFFVATSSLYRDSVNDLNVAVKSINDFGDKIAGRNP